jgi:cytochrome bd-type quinol oxidase subunit 2
MGVYLTLLAVWMFYRTGVVRVVRTYQLLGASTTLTVFGFLLILLMLTLWLMNPATNPQLMLIVTVLGLFFMLLGTLIIRSDKHVIQLHKDVR